MVDIKHHFETSMLKILISSLSCIFLIECLLITTTKQWGFTLIIEQSFSIVYKKLKFYSMTHCCLWSFLRSLQNRFSTRVSRVHTCMETKKCEPTKQVITGWVEMFSFDIISDQRIYEKNVSSIGCFEAFSCTLFVFSTQLCAKWRFLNHYIVFENSTNLSWRPFLNSDRKGQPVSDRITHLTI